MSVSRPARCLLSAPSSAARPVPSTRCFHTSPKLAERRRPRFASVKAADMGLVSSPKNAITSAASKPAAEVFKPYTKEEKEILSKRYTPSQLRAIEAGEAAISPEDLKVQGRTRHDYFRLPYLDDLSVIRPRLDNKVKQPLSNDIGLKTRWMTEDERMDHAVKWFQDIRRPGLVPTDEKQVLETRGESGALQRPSRIDMWKYFDDPAHAQVGVEPGHPSSGDSLAPPVPKLDNPDIRYKQKGEVGDEEGHYDALKKQTGLTLQEIRNLKVKILVQHRVVNQTRLGKISSIYNLAIAGNGNGLLGIGEGKGGESDESAIQARIAAIRNMKPIPRYEYRTIFGDVEGKVAATEVKLMSRPPGTSTSPLFYLNNADLVSGFGLRVQHNIFEMARAAGIEDLAARVPRSRNKMNTVKAAYQALMSQRSPEEVARGLGRKLVDVRKVYYGGRV